MSEYTDRPVAETSPAPQPEPFPLAEDTVAIPVYGRTVTEIRPVSVDEAGRPRTPRLHAVRVGDPVDRAADGEAHPDSTASADSTATDSDAAPGADIALDDAADRTGRAGAPDLSADAAQAAGSPAGEGRRK
ncbi:hypothetical protein ACFWVP_17475 [Streptomyces sp. NPDC058637]|uniref:hypothetical protein n=1 Tax=Streptomyces sp. NPDC058637 TaxID=3346569 RepID=UPI00365BFE33